MEKIIDFLDYILVAGGGAAAVLFLYIKFWGKTFVEKRVNESLKTKQHELDAELEKLKTANIRVNHIMLSLYEEEKEAIKEISAILIESVHNVHSLVTFGE